MMAATGKAADPASQLRPRLALRIGITGHRPPRLSQEQFDRIKTQCGEVLKLARTSLDTLQSNHSDIFSDEAPICKLVSSLAEGADVLAAEAALENGLGLSACLPFKAEIYQQDFDGESWKTTASLIERADAVMALADFDGGDEAAYETAGRVVLSQVDILIAVWDGKAARGRGGTAELIAEAVASHVPIIHIDARSEVEPLLLWSGLKDVVPDRPSLAGVARKNATALLPALIEALCEPPREDQRDELHAFVHGVHRIEGRAWGWPMLLALTGAKTWKKTSFSTPKAATCASYMKPQTTPFSTHGAFGHRLDNLMLNRFGQADAEATAFALRFRSSFVTNFALAALAVLLALAGLLAPAMKLLFIAIELLVILLIIANTRRANRKAWHRRWLDRRSLAEQLRQLVICSTLGQLSLRSGEDVAMQPGWVNWYARANARQLGLIPADFDRSFLEKVRANMVTMIDDQIGYHEGNAKTMMRANRRLHSIGDLLFVGTILACATYIGYWLLFGVPSSDVKVGMAEIVTFITALFPALAAALYGIRMQGDFAASAERSDFIARSLGRLKSSMLADDVSYEGLVERSRRLGDIMMGEVDQWRVHFESRPLRLPG
ncbi:hypothetical protein [Sphingomicrobium sediminis]|uniref:SMODS and SLOG-associating 2TM effector domain-containing protein n=1 Tax=Sphingomicrobium sediminis TaxID=2950949 RepID=A0A9X2J0W3_9SPHN|nr:hypothetical protein [Sphingomicrobium sediminis]MCM8556673.1 hypothetical protein [Sphingomicrobium sediminis]